MRDAVGILALQGGEDVKNFFSMQEVQDALRKQGVSEEVAQKCKTP